MIVIILPSSLETGLSDSKKPVSHNIIFFFQITLRAQLSVLFLVAINWLEYFDRMRSFTRVVIRNKKQILIINKSRAHLVEFSDEEGHRFSLLYYILHDWIPHHLKYVQYLETGHLYIPSDMRGRFCFLRLAGLKSSRRLQFSLLVACGRSIFFRQTDKNRVSLKEEHSVFSDWQDVVEWHEEHKKNFHQSKQYRDHRERSQSDLFCNSCHYTCSDLLLRGHSRSMAMGPQRQIRSQYSLATL